MKVKPLMPTTTPKATPIITLLKVCQPIDTRAQTCRRRRTKPSAEVEGRALRTETSNLI
jgi:hypothetical protein